VARRFALTLVLLGLAAAPAHAAAPASLYDAPGQMHDDVCAHLAGTTAPLLFGDGGATGFSVTNAFTFDPGQCLDGMVRLDLHELLPSGLGPLAFHRGGNGYIDDKNVKYGELATGALADQLPARRTLHAR
jgi:hypothetical protein